MVVADIRQLRDLTTLRSKQPLWTAGIPAPGTVYRKIFDSKHLKFFADTYEVFGQDGKLYYQTDKLALVCGLPSFTWQTSPQPRVSKILPGQDMRHGMQLLAAPSLLAHETMSGVASRRGHDMLDVMCRPVTICRSLCVS